MEEMKKDENLEAQEAVEETVETVEETAEAVEAEEVLEAVDEILLTVVSRVIGDFLHCHTGSREHVFCTVNPAQYNIFIRRIASMCLKFP